jgi:hypothetical protein
MVGYLFENKFGRFCKRYYYFLYLCISNLKLYAMESKILIVIEGGIVQNVISDNPDVLVAIIDYDKHSDDPVLVRVSTPDEVYNNMADVFNCGRNKLDKYERLARKTLRRENFI